MKSYGDFMRAPFKCHVKPIRAKWLRHEMVRGERQPSLGVQHSQQSQTCGYQDPHSTPVNQEKELYGGILQGKKFKIIKQEIC